MTHRRDADERDALRLLTINTGSSSLKAALYDVDGWERRDLTVRVERIGSSGSRMRINDAAGAALLDEPRDLPDHAAAIDALIGWLQGYDQERRLDAVGHRVVHGGKRYRTPHLIFDEVVAELRRLIPVDPDHLPQALGAIVAARKAFPGVPQVACFDTAFHRRMPRVARQYPLPRRFGQGGLLRYGFHGLSCESIMHDLGTIDRAAARGRVIIAHLGNGASMTAVRAGHGIDTTMGFSPTGGLMMGTRSGDLDPGVLLYLLQSRGMSPAALSRLVNQEAGLLGVSGASADMRDLLAGEMTDPRAAEAIALFCYQARKYLGALTAVLGGLDSLVFTGGIGERAAPIRERICAGLEHLGIRLDPHANGLHGPIISRHGSPVTVRMMATDEDRIIARHTARLIRRSTT